ncbi:MAG: putative immunity protein [Eubacteriaceae bacterium]
MYAKIIQGIQDDVELREELQKIFESKSHKAMVKYSLLLGRHIMDLTNTQPCGEISEAYEISEKWLEGKAKFTEARAAAIKIHRLAHNEEDPVMEKVYRIMVQVAATPHVKNHALIASDYAIKLINTMYPDNAQEVSRERQEQIKLMKSL